MGFRLASLRRTNVVMAPAFTCIIFVKDFSTLIENYQYDFAVIICANGNSQTCFEQFRLMYVKVDCIIFVIKKTAERHAKSGKILGCARVLQCNDVLIENYAYFASDKCPFVVAYHIMNESDSMGDKSDNMGLQKIDMPNFGGNLNVKEKQRFAPAVDILSNFEREMCPNENNFRQECDEFLKIIANNNDESIVSVAAAAAAAGVQDDEEKTAPATVAATTNGQVYPDASDIASENLISLERALLNQVESIAALEEDNAEIALPDPKISYAELSEEKRKRCLQMERRIDRLTRRLKLKQGKMFGTHASEQICGLLEYCRCKSLEANNLKSEPNTTHSSAAAAAAAAVDASLNVYLKRLKRCSEQSCVPLNNERVCNYFGSGTKETRNGRSFAISVAPKFDSVVHEHIEKISGQLHAQVKAIANEFDSDATASSSGNDSLDEESPLPLLSAEDKSKRIPL